MLRRESISGSLGGVAAPGGRAAGRENRAHRPLVYFFSPANVSECREQAARTARSNDAMRVLISVCYSKFPSN